MKTVKTTATMKLNDLHVKLTLPTHSVPSLLISLLLNFCFI